MRYDRLFGLFIVIVMLGSLAGVAIYNIGEDPDDPNVNPIQGESDIEVNGFYFYEDPSIDGFIASVRVTEDGNIFTQYPVAFRTDPRNVSDIFIEEEAVTRLINAQKIYYTHNPNIYTPLSEDTQNIRAGIQLAMPQVIRLISRTNLNNFEPVGAITEDIPNETYDDQIPLKNCDDATETTAVLFFAITSEDAVRIKDNCITISGKTGDSLISTADKYGMHLLGLTV